MGNCDSHLLDKWELKAVITMSMSSHKRFFQDIEFLPFGRTKRRSEKNGDKS